MTSWTERSGPPATTWSGGILERSTVDSALLLNVGQVTTPLVGHGQSFTMPEDGKITEARFLIRRNITTLPTTGKIVAKVYAMTGLFGSTARPTGSPLGTSSEILVSNISNSHPAGPGGFIISGIERTGLVFTFTPFSLVAGQYVLTFEITEAISQGNISVGFNTGNAHAGCWSRNQSGSWANPSLTQDLNFRLFASFVDWTERSGPPSTSWTERSAPDATSWSERSALSELGWLEGPFFLQKQSSEFYEGVRGILGQLTPTKGSDNFYTLAGEQAPGETIFGRRDHNFMETVER